MKLQDKLTISDLADSEFQGKRVLIRVDFNVPQNKETLAIENTARIDAAMPTIEYALAKGAKVVILMSHLGRPNGKVNKKYTLKPCIDVLKKNLGFGDDKVLFAEDCIGKEATKVIDAAPTGSVVLLENLRFYPEEEGKGEKNGQKVTKEDIAVFRKELTALGELYINDAFGTAHRAHSSMVGIDLPRRAAGFLMGKELEYFAKALEHPEREFLAILGGAKVSDKIQLIKHMLGGVDKLIICGGMAFTFKKVYFKVPIGNSLFDAAGGESIERGELITEENKGKFIFPEDYVVSPRFDISSSDPDVGEIKERTDKDGIADNTMGLDAGPKSREKFREAILNAKTILWNGPPGVFENSLFQEGSKAMLAACEEACANGATVIIGGGDTATVVSKFGNPDKLSHVSTGGGASLELLEGKTLPGVDKLSSKSEA